MSEARAPFGLEAISGWKGAMKTKTATLQFINCALPDSVNCPVALPAAPLITSSFSLWKSVCFSIRPNHTVLGCA